MKVKNHIQIPIFQGHESSKLELSHLAKESLLDAGYHVKDFPEIWNGHQVFAQIKDNEKVICFAGQFYLSKESGKLMIAGGLEHDLDETASTQLAHASSTFLCGLTKDREQNSAFIARCHANNQMLGKGTFVKVHAAACNVAESQPIKTMLITDGQRSTGALIEDYTRPLGVSDAPQNDNGKQIFYPRSFSKLLTPVEGLVKINNFTIPKENDRNMASAFCIENIGKTQGRFTANLIAGNKQSRTDADVLAVFHEGKFKGSIAGESAINIAIDRMAGNNKKNGYRPEVLLRNGRPDITVPHEKVSQIIKELENTNSCDMS